VVKYFYMAENMGRSVNDITPEQIADLRAHFEKLDETALKKAYNQTIEDTQGDAKFYKKGGNPSMTNMSIALLQDIMDDRNIKY
jgi:ABC-type transporter MlaC component